MHYVHRLIAFAFLPPPVGEQTQVHHIDGDAGNNHPGNLQWVSAREHMDLHMADDEKMDLMVISMVWGDGPWYAEVCEEIF